LPKRLDDISGARSSLTPRLFRAALATSLTLSALLFFLWSWRWPLVGDASLIHYIGFLIQRGWAPYRDLGDMNMPGSFLIEIAAMHIFGMGDLAWRLFDFTLLAIASASFFIICSTPANRASTNRVPVACPERSRRVREATVGSFSRLPAISPSFLAALFSASLFILIHGRDGLAEGGQRDLTMAVLLLTATAFLFVAVRKDSKWSAATFGLLSGIAFTIKPTALPLSLAQLLLAANALRRFRIDFLHLGRKNANRSVLIHYIAPAAAAGLIAPTIALIFLLREHALAAFLAGFRGIIPYYASLGHRSVGFVLLHSISPLLPIVIAWLIVLVLQRKIFYWSRNWERNALLIGVLFGLLNCIAQQRALPYYRYPLLVFLLPLMALHFVRTFDAQLTTELGAPSQTASPSEMGSRAAQTLAVLTLAYAAFVLAPQSAILIHRYRWRETDFITSLQQNLNSLGGPALSGHIQCIDSISGCGNVLYRMRLEPATGVLSDFLLFGSVSDNQPPESISILRDTRAQFSTAILAHPPQVIIVTSHLHIDGPDNFEKLARWPAFASFLADRYTLHTEWSPNRTARWWSREETPASYRIYVLRPNAAGAPRSQSDRGVSLY